MKFNKLLICTALLASVSLASCATSADYHTLSAGEIQLPGHPYKTAKDCARKAPIGKFDDKCDIPLLAWRGAKGLDLPSVSQGAPGGFGL